MSPGTFVEQPSPEVCSQRILGFVQSDEYGPEGLLGGNCIKQSPNGISDSGTERERRRDNLRLCAPFLRQRRFEWVLKEVAKRWDSAAFRNLAVTLTTGQ